MHVCTELTITITTHRSLQNGKQKSACDGSSRSKRIDPYGYRLVGCRIGANAIRLHDEVVTMVAKLFRTLRLDAIVEPTRLFNSAGVDASSQRPDTMQEEARKRKTLTINV